MPCTGPLTLSEDPDVSKTEGGGQGEEVGMTQVPFLQAAGKCLAGREADRVGHLHD